MEISRAKKDDLNQLLQLYTQLHNNSVPVIGAELKNQWADILCDRNYYIFVGKEDGKIICSCTMIIVSNLTHEQRPYAFIENVITDVGYRNKGYATALLNTATDTARGENCYKIMLMTSSKEDSTLNFYKKAGFNSNDKTAFIQWL